MMKKIANNKSVKNMKIMAILLLVCTIILSGCVIKGQNNTETNPEINITPTGNVTPKDNATGGRGIDGERYIYGTAAVETIQVITMESFPVKVQVVAQGYLPDSCTEINEIKTEKEENRFNVSISTKRPKDAICTEAIVPFNETIPLDVQGLKAGNYTVNVNGVKGSFELAVDNILNEQPSPMPPRQQVITEADNGKNISLKNGETFYLRLEENPTTGYSWELNLSQGLNNITDNYYPPESSKDNKQPLVGAGGVHLWEIKASAEGSQQVKGIYKRPWENIAGTEDNFTLNVEVM
jgi:inhibitor of cysteine peptidase